MRKILLLLVCLCTYAAFAQTEINDEKIYEMVEDMPQFPGGNVAMTDFIKKNIQYPEAAAEKRIQGRVVITCVVGKDGNIDKDDIKVSTSRGAELDNEAVRIVKSMPKWIPGKQNGQNVNVRYNIPVIFKIDNEKNVLQQEKRTPREMELIEYVMHNYYDRCISGYWKYGIPKDTVKHIMKAASEIIAINPNNDLAYQVLIQANNALGDYEKALSVIDEWEKTKTEHFGVPLFRGYYYDITDEKEKADEQYRKALTLIDNNKEIPLFISIMQKIGIIDDIEGEAARDRYIKQTLDFYNNEGLNNTISDYMLKYEKSREDRKSSAWKNACGAPVNLSGQNSQEERRKAASFYP